MPAMALALSEKTWVVTIELEGGGTWINFLQATIGSSIVTRQPIIRLRIMIDILCVKN